MEVHVTLEGPGELSARIYRQLLEAVLDGRLRSGERLPPTRELARRLAVSRNTVALAYERLTAEGVVAARVGSGTFVAAAPLVRSRRAAAAPSGLRRAPAGADLRPRAIWTELAARPGLSPLPASQAPPYDFRVGLPDARIFPFTTWRRLVARELRPAALPSAAYGEPGGHPGLRAAIARHFGVSRSLRADAGDVIVTQGAQQALDLVTRVLVAPGDIVAVEEPGYRPARRLFESAGARVIGVPVDEEGIVVERLPRTARLVYVTPSHQFPLGVAMSMARRVALLEWAAARNAVVLEDDYDSEFRFGGRPLEPLQSLDRAGRVVYVGSFSKVLLPALRLGFLVAPAALGPALAAAKRLTDWHGELPTQAALARFLDDGHLARHLRRASRTYAGRRARILEILARDFRDRLAPVASAAGLHLAARTAPGIDVGVVVGRARGLGVAVRSLAEFAAEPGDPAAPAGLAIGYGAIAEAAIPSGLARLAEAFRAAGGQEEGAG